MSDYKFTSVFAPYMNAVIEIEKAKGAVDTNVASIFRGFDSYANEHGLSNTFITERFIADWRMSRVNDSERTISLKISAWRKLLTLMNRRGCMCYVPRPMRAPKSTFVPYIFTHEELASIWAAVDSWKLHKHIGESALIALPALYRLLYSSGLRIGEALAIKNKDLDMESGTILIHATKRESERIIILSESMKSTIQDYIGYRDKLPIAGLNHPEKSLFVKINGTPVASNTVYNNFRNILRKCGISCGDRGPCVHSLRHTYAVHSLAKMTAEGMNIYAALPILSASMGHHSLESTEYYVRLTRMTYAEIEKNSSAINAFIYPSKSKYNEDED